MKYKKHIATGVLALSLLVGGSSAFAEIPVELERGSTAPLYQRQSRGFENYARIKRNNLVGNISMINNNGFTIEIKNKKTGQISSVDVITDNSTIYKKNGLDALLSDLVIGEKVIIKGDNANNSIISSSVNIITNTHSRIIH